MLRRKRWYRTWWRETITLFGFENEPIQWVRVVEFESDRKWNFLIFRKLISETKKMSNNTIYYKLHALAYFLFFFTELNIIFCSPNNFMVIAVNKAWSQSINNNIMLLKSKHVIKMIFQKQKTQYFNIRNHEKHDNKILFVLKSKFRSRTVRVHNEPEKHFIHHGMPIILCELFHPHSFPMLWNGAESKVTTNISTFALV